MFTPPNVLCHVHMCIILSVTYLCIHQNDYSKTSDDISETHQLSYVISTNYQYYKSCKVLVFYDDFDDPFQNFNITTTVKECQLEG